MNHETPGLKEFAQKVQAMRVAQQAYFKSRRSDVLEASKRLEREVDSELKRILTEQRSLFDV